MEAQLGNVVADTAVEEQAAEIPEVRFCFLAGERWLAPGEPAEISDLFLLYLSFTPLQFEPIERLEELGVNKRKQANNILFLASPRENFPTTLAHSGFFLQLISRKLEMLAFSPSISSSWNLKR